MADLQGITTAGDDTLNVAFSLAAVAMKIKRRESTALGTAVSLCEPVCRGKPSLSLSTNGRECVKATVGFETPFAKQAL